MKIWSLVYDDEYGNHSQLLYSHKPKLEKITEFVEYQLDHLNEIDESVGAVLINHGRYSDCDSGFRFLLEEVEVHVA